MTGDKVQTPGPDTKGQQVSTAPTRATSPFWVEASSLNRPKLGRMGKHLQRGTPPHAVQTTDQASSSKNTVSMNTDSETAHQDKHICETQIPTGETRSLPSAATASSATVNGQATAQQEQQIPPMTSQPALAQSPDANNLTQAGLLRQPRQPLQTETQQSPGTPSQQHTARTGGDKDASQHTPQPTKTQRKEATADPSSQSRDKETQATVPCQDAVVQTDNTAQS